MKSRSVFWLMLIFIPGVAMAIEEPKFKLIEKHGSYELRGYEDRIVAETTVSGSFKNASSAGFKLIADYIFGNNRTQSGQNQKISMTAPVGMVPSSEKISMTAPVNMAPTQGDWRIQFYMPRQYTLDSLPKPNNSAVSLRVVPAQNMAVLQFSGLVSKEKMKTKSAALLNWLEGKKIKPRGDPLLARYNPPWTLPFLRRNEVMVAY